MDFAPYQDTTPESTRALSPPPNRISSPTRNAKSPPPNRPKADPFRTTSLPEPSHFSDEPRGNAGFGGGDIENGRLDVNLFETSLPLRLDYEAMLAYLLLPPAGGVFLLVVEHKSDYVRYVMLGERGLFGPQIFLVDVPRNGISTRQRFGTAHSLPFSPLRMGCCVSLFFCMHTLTRNSADSMRGNPVYYSPRFS